MERRQFLAFSLAALLTPDALHYFTEEYVGEFDADLATFGSRFRSNIESAPYHAKWVAANKIEAAKWAVFRDAVLTLTGKTDEPQPVPPTMSTRYGRAIVAAGEMHMSISRVVGMMANRHPPPPPPDPSGGAPLPPNGWAGPLVISAGGTYDGRLTGVGWESTTSSPAILIQTTQPVLISGWVRCLAGGHLVDAEAAGASQVTLDHIFAYGGTPYQNSGRLYRAYAFKSFTMQNCTIENTRGVELQEPVAASGVVITRNRHHNIQGWNNPAGDTDVGGLVQCRILQNATIDISWNEVVNEYNLSEPTDIISLYFTAHARVHDNYIQHQSRIGNVTPSSQNTITSEGDSRLNDNIIEDNQVIDAYGIGLHANAGMGHDNSVLNNRIIGDQFLPTGTQKANGAGSPLYIATGGTNNHAHGNTVGYIDSSATYIDSSLLAASLTGAPEGGAAEAANNTLVPQGQINASLEAAEWGIWLAKLASNGITIGA